MKRRILKWAALVMVLVLVSISAYWVYVYREVRFNASRDEAQAADAIIVLGAAQYNGRPSKILKARLDHVLELYNKRLAKAVITTGGYGPDPNYSEAKVSTQYLTQHGIPAEDIITEQASLTTRDSVRAATVLMKDKSWTKVVVVSDGFHLYRLKEMLADEGIVAYTSPAPDSPIEGSASKRFWYSLREVFLFSAYRLVDL
jgi:uncharacterized SAM-binding protein YcdF (DUF218 family)